MIPSEVLAERLRFEGLKFTFVSRELRFPNGSEGERQYIQHPGGALVVPIDSEGRFLCIRQYRFAVSDYIYEFPAGTLEPSETPAETIRRELPEETGFIAHRWDSLGQIYLAPGYSDEVLYMFLARDLIELPIAPLGDEDEDIFVVPMTAAELTEQMQSSARFDAKTIAAFWRAQHFLAHEQSTAAQQQ